MTTVSRSRPVRRRDRAALLPRLHPLFGAVEEVACVRCGDGPLLGGDLAAGDETATAVAGDWMVGVGWRLSGPMCPGCVSELSR